MTLRDFDVVKVLGRGAYGVVYKVVRKSDGKSYAMKEVALGAMKQRERYVEHGAMVVERG